MTVIIDGYCFIFMTITLSNIYAALLIIYCKFSHTLKYKLSSIFSSYKSIKKFYFYKKKVRSILQFIFLHVLLSQKINLFFLLRRRVTKYFLITSSKIIYLISHYLNPILTLLITINEVGLRA